MNLCNERLATGCTIKETIASVLCQTMPTTAAASGLCSQVDFSPVVARLHAAYADEKLSRRTPNDLGLTNLCDWLAAKGETVGRAVVKLWRDELIAEALRRGNAAGSVPFVHLRAG